MLTALWSSAALAPGNGAAAAAYRTLIMTVRRLVVGRRLAVRLTGISFAPDLVRLSGILPEMAAGGAAAAASRHTQERRS
jgi:hypothetical protein